MCFTLIWKIEPQIWQIIPFSASSSTIYSPWFVVRSMRFQLAIFPEGWRIFRSEDTKEHDIEYETCLDPDANTPQATAILPKDSITSERMHDCKFSDMKSEHEALTLRLRVRSSEPGFCRFRTVVRFVSRFKVKITSFSHEIEIGANHKGQVNKFLVPTNFMPPLKTSEDQEDHKHVIIKCSQYGQVYFTLSNGYRPHRNSYVTVSLIDPLGKKIVSQTLQPFINTKFYTYPPLSAIGNNLLVEWFERQDEALEIVQNSPYTHLPLDRNRYYFPYQSSFPVKKPSQFSAPDFILEAETMSFTVHSQVLLQHSEFFRGMLETDMKEKKEGRVVLDTDAETAERIVKFLYDGVVESTLVADQVFSLYLAATMYQIRDLHKDCSSLLASKLDPSSVCGILALAEAHHDHRLKTKAQNFICASREDVLNSSEWRLFMNSHRPLASEVKHIVESCSGRQW